MRHLFLALCFCQLGVSGVGCWWGDGAYGVHGESTHGTYGANGTYSAYCAVLTGAEPPVPLGTPETKKPTLTSNAGFLQVGLYGLKTCKSM